MIDIRSVSTSCKFAAIVGMFYIVVCIAIAAVPEALFSTIDWKSRAALHTFAAIDLVIGVVLIWAAPSSRSPVGLNTFGVLALLGAVFYFLVPIELVASYFDFWLVELLVLTRIVSIMFGLPLGALILFAAISSPTSPNENSASHMS